MKKNIAVIGAGISGISIAALLQEQAQITVFEKRPYTGGLVHCERIQGYLYHRVGGHVFNSKNKEVLAWFWSKFDKEKEFVQAKRNAKILFGTRLIGYPVENFLYEFDRTVVEQVLAELLEIQTKGPRDPMSYPDFEAFLKGNFGTTLYDIYFKPYNEKIWRTDLSTVSMEWLEGKLPMPRLLEMITANIVRQEEAGMVHASFYYPKNGGSQFIADRLSEGLDIRYSQATDRIIVKEGKCNIGEQWFDALVYTGDVRQLPSLLQDEEGKPVHFPEPVVTLRSNGTSSILCSCDANDLSWLYIPESQYKAHRIIYTGNFSQTNNPPQAGRSSCVVEFSGICSEEDMKEELTRLPGNLVPIDVNQEPQSYVIQDKHTRAYIRQYRDILSGMNIHLLGRFAEWEYYNMDKAMEAAFALRKTIIQE